MKSPITRIFFYSKTPIFRSGDQVEGAEQLQRVGEVFKYFAKPMVAAVNITEGVLRAGDTIRIKGATTDLTMTVGSMQIDMNSVEEAKAGEGVGIKVTDRVRPGDVVYKV